MEPSETLLEENRRLRRTMRDLVALSTLPAVWIGLEPDGIARSLADVLLSTLSLDFIYVRLSGLAGEGVVEVVRSKRSAAAPIAVARAAVASLFEAGKPEPPATMLDPFGDGALRIAVTRFGISDDHGVLVTGSRSADFPTEQDRLLLGVGANQTAIVVRRRRAEAQVHEQREWLRVMLASIGDAVIATDTTGRVTLMNSVAEQLTGRTSSEAEGSPLEEIFVILDEMSRGRVTNPVERVLRDGVVVGLGNHTILVARDGTERPIDDSAAPIRDAAGQMIGVVLIFRDVTEQRQSEREVRQSEARTRAILETALDCIITMDDEGRVIEFNPAAERTFGLRQEQVVGRDLASLIIPPPLRARHREGLARYLATGEGPFLGKRLELSGLRADGIELPLEAAITRIQTDGPPLFTAYLRDISEAKRVEQHRNVRLTVTHALSAAASVEEGASGVLRGVCENLGWDVGFFWMLDEAGSALRCTKSWHLPEVPVDEFEASSSRRAFGRGEGLPGRVWESGKPAWVLDVLQETNFLRLAAAARYGLHSAFACPITVGDQLSGVMEFFTRHIREPDADLLEMMWTVAGSVGQFLDRKAAEDELRRSEQQLSDFFENATVGLHWVGPDGIILRANRAELEMLGYERDEYVGRPIAEFHADEDVIRDILGRLQSGKKLDEHPARLRCKDGSIKDVLIDSSVLWRDGRFIHTRCFTRDVTERKRTDEALRQSEARFRGLMEQAPFSIQLFSPEGRTTRVNRAWEELWGLRLEHLERYNILEDPQLEARGILSHIHQGFAGQAAQVPAIEYDASQTIPGMPPQEDPRRWISAVIYPLKDAEGRIEEVALIHADITAQTRAEASLRESEEKLRLLADTIPQLAWMARPDGHIFWYNRRWTEFTGLPDTEGNEAWRQLMHPDDARSAGERWAASLDSGEPFEREIRLLDRRRRAYRWHLIRTQPVRDEGGRVTRWFGTSTDIHEQKRAEERARYLADASAALAGVVDYESTLQKVSTLAVPYFADWSAVDMAREDGSLHRLAVFHLDAGKIALAHELMRDYPPDPRSPTGPAAVLRTGRPEINAEITDELLERGAKDERHLHLLRSLGLKSSICVPLVVSGNTLGVLTFVTAESGRRYNDADLALAMDLAQRASIAVENTQLYQALRDTDRRKDEFLATLAHELRNPLAPIRNSLQILKMPRVDRDTVERSRVMMERQVHHLIRLVDDLMDVSRVMRGKIELRRERIELATVVARAVETVQPLLDAQHHQLSVSLPAESLSIDADQVRLAQVVNNLLTNAAKYTEPNGRIWLTAERDGDGAVLRVRDTGIGIAREMLPRIFELFVQADHASTKAQGGLGIGLTLVKNLVEMHNGRVAARSGGLGQGSEFIVWLPLSARWLEPARDHEAGRYTPRPRERQGEGPQPGSPTRA